MSLQPRTKQGLVGQSGGSGGRPPSVTSNLGSTQIPEEARKLLDQGNWKEAVDELGSALETDPRNLSLWRERANALVALNRFDDALFCYERMLAIDPADTSIYAEKAEVLQSLDRDDEALACYDRALEHAPSNVSFLKAKALLLSRLKSVPEAILVYERLLQLRPQDPEFLIAIGDALISAGQI